MFARTTPGSGSSRRSAMAADEPETVIPVNPDEEAVQVRPEAGLTPSRNPRLAGSCSCVNLADHSQIADRVPRAAPHPLWVHWVLPMRLRAPRSWLARRGRCTRPAAGLASVPLRNAEPRRHLPSTPPPSSPAQTDASTPRLSLCLARPGGRPARARVDSRIRLSVVVALAARIALPPPHSWLAHAVRQPAAFRSREWP